MVYSLYEGVGGGGGKEIPLQWRGKRGRRGIYLAVKFPIDFAPFPLCMDSEQGIDVSQLYSTGYSSVQSDTLQYSRILYSTVGYYTVQSDTLQYSRILYSTVGYSSVQ
jgi:hypothetical protein